MHHPPPWRATGGIEEHAVIGNLHTVALRRHRRHNQLSLCAVARLSVRVRVAARSRSRRQVRARGDVRGRDAHPALPARYQRAAHASAPRRRRSRDLGLHAALRQRHAARHRAPREGRARRRAVHDAMCAALRLRARRAQRPPDGRGHRVRVAGLGDAAPVVHPTRESRGPTRVPASCCARARSRRSRSSSSSTSARRRATTRATSPRRSRRPPTSGARGRRRPTTMVDGERWSCARR